MFKLLDPIFKNPQKNKEPGSFLIAGSAGSGAKTVRFPVPGSVPGRPVRCVVTKWGPAICYFAGD